MCGTAGLISWWHGPTRNRLTVQAMTETLAHRGPDATDIWAANGAAIGHTRLAIIDLAGGGQPMVLDRPDVAGTLVLSFTGEIYNHRELRDRLRALSHDFRGRSDTEVILHAHQQWGEQAVQHLRGIFALRGELAVESWSRWGLAGIDSTGRQRVMGGATFAETNLELQLAGVTIFWIVRNANAMRSSYVDGLGYPKSAQLYGARWFFTN